jgi:hypothetical protein
MNAADFAHSASIDDRPWRHDPHFENRKPMPEPRNAPFSDAGRAACRAHATKATRAAFDDRPWPIIS